MAFADFLNNDEKFHLLDDKKANFNNKDNSFILDRSNRADSNVKDKKEEPISYIKQEKGDNNNKTTNKNNNYAFAMTITNLYPNNKLTIKLFVQIYTEFSKFECDAHHNFKWSSFIKTSQN